MCLETPQGAKRTRRLKPCPAESVRRNGKQQLG
jgi:hypothetical protein